MRRGGNSRPELQLRCTRQAQRPVTQSSSLRPNSRAASAAARTAKRVVTTIAITALDQNGDGEVDQEDVRILTQKSLAVSKAVVKDVASSSLVKDTAAAAAVGAVIAIPVPLVGPATGAVIGAALGAYSNLRKK